jgi:hypothetical protein
MGLLDTIKGWFRGSDAEPGQEADAQPGAVNDDLEDKAAEADQKPDSQDASGAA